MNNNFKSLLVPVGTTILCGIAGSMIYLYYIRKRDKEDEEGNVFEPVIKSYEMVVPEVAVGHIYGRQGSNLKFIEMNTVTEIRFKDSEDETQRICVINGIEENINLAERLIQKVVDNLPVTKVQEYYVPSHACNHIVGRNGETLKDISRTSGAKVSFTMENPNNIDPGSPQENGLRRLVIKGSEDQINSAQNLLAEKVEEAAELKQKIESSAVNLSMRSRANKLTPTNSTDSVDFGVNIPHQESLLSPSTGKSMDVYVSAVDTAAHFWVQVVNPRSIQLDALVSSMTDFYGEEENCENYRPDEINDGDLVAAKFPHDSSWYRGQICLDKANPPGDGMTTVYYLDFGDTETISTEFVCELRTDFLRLNFQAIECVLADVDYESAVGDEAADTFEELSFAAQWKPVKLTVTGFHQLGAKTLPVVKLHSSVDIGEKLIELGLARRKSQSTPSSLE